ncbi:TetR family transcriptional regulator [Dethiosulfatarculus sandiegensis]|uniref:HTH tetR-type domain-containing protein n=1 Tax=Dethiosulfatarculus sandiegensis TaxID=1429043 RepID=A0A0D2J323_9BACT|nr:TetR family transcriptional regulator [Dethiosulfatarculus sandiegensis]KIX12574.1 hypothetical protein X474_18390 [Dethiosulfatarculus sandiegensis]
MAMNNKNAPQDQTETTPKERIFEAAVKLFGQKSSTATGVREIAKEAGVNVAMISYFYGSKQGLLEALLEKYFIRFTAIVEEVIGDAEIESIKDYDSYFRQFTEKVIRFYVENPNLVRVVMMEMPLDSPRNAEIKAAWWKQVLKRFSNLTEHLLPQDPSTLEAFGIIGPAFNSATASHFLLMPIIEKVGAIRKDEQFFDRYCQLMTEFCLHGYTGVFELLCSQSAAEDQTSPYCNKGDQAPPG